MDWKRGCKFELAYLELEGEHDNRIVPEEWHEIARRHWKGSSIASAQINGQ